ncbi:MAG: hypothetical protein JKY65_21370 [Planctomycetes bacterium]|nr:hypothetical protein [Planctomycetota bacterium]
MKGLHSIRVRLTAAAVLSVAAFALLLGVATRSWIERDLREGLRTFARHEAHEFASVVGDAKTRADLIAKRPRLDRLFPERGVVSLDLWAVNGELVLAYPPEGAAPRAWSAGLREALAGREPWEEHTIQGAPPALRTATVISVAGEPRWVAVTSVKTDPVARSLSRFTRFYLLGVIVLVALSAGGAYVLVSRALLPVRSLVQTAERLAAQPDLQGRLDSLREGSELAELVGLINRLLTKAEETVTRLRHFTAHAGHELRTPLSRMRGEVEQALRSGSEAEGISALHGVLEEIDAQRSVLDALLELAHSGEPLDLSLQTPLNLSELVEEVAEEAQHLPECRTREVTLEVQPELRVLAHKPLIARALWNLIHNAISYSCEGGRISVRVSRGSDRALVEVENAPAEGLPPLGEALFEPFARAEHAGEIRSEGHGLGLPLSRAIVRRHGGDLTGGSRLDGQVWVRLELPVVP